MEVEPADPPAETEVLGQQPIKEELNPIEIWWHDHQNWLAEKGYMLRPRYRPGWQPSWAQSKKKYTHPRDYEDGVHPNLINVLDATRVSDNSLVALKRVRNRGDSVVGFKNPVC